MSEHERESGGLPGTVRDPKFTLPTKRLAGSPACLNCGTRLEGPFCHYCGQPDRNFMRFFPVLLREFMEDFLELDSRFVRTLKPLLFRPGKLTRDYLDGRRFRYTPPMRLYLFTSIGCLMLAALLSGNAMHVNRFESGKGVIKFDSGLSEEDRQRAEQALAQLPEEVRSQIDLETGPAPDGEERGDDGEMFKAKDFNFNGKPWDRETNPVAIDWLPDRVNDWINEQIERSPEKAREINQNPRLIVDKVFDILPGTMFVLLPVVALLFKFWYLFARRYYIEHLIFALHNHAFIFTALILVLLLGLAQDGLGGAGVDWLATAAQWLRIAVLAWVPVYLLISLRTVYRQNWFLTVLKFGVIGISYLILLTFVTVTVALVSFVLL